MKLDDSPPGMNNILSGEKNPGHAFWVSTHDSPDGKHHLSSGHADPWNTVIDPDEFATNQWTFVAVTYDPAVDGGTMTLFKNGTMVDGTATSASGDDGLATGVSGIGNNDYRAFIGSYRTSGPYFKGYIDDARIYNRALSAQQIEQLHNAGAGDHNTIVSEETDEGDEWQCLVTPFSADAKGATRPSNTLTIQSAPSDPGSITIVKAAPEDDTVQFSFTGDLSTFSLKDGENLSFTDLNPSDYDVTENLPSGWILGSIDCAGGDSDPIAGGVTIHLDPGEDITCTFTNVLPGPTDPQIDNLSLNSASGNYYDNEDLICDYDLAGGATTAATAWYLGNSPFYYPLHAF